MQRIIWYKAEKQRLIRTDRRQLENPYAHLQEDGNFDAQVPNSPSGKYLPEEIIKRIADTNVTLPEPDDPITLLEPEFVFQLIGYSYSTEGSLGQFDYGKIEVAGIIDNSLKEVKISQQFPYGTQRFTAAHEIGHAVLHPNLAGLHRDRSVDGSTSSKQQNIKEVEADKFAAYFLMPKKLVKKLFKQYFLTDCFTLNEETKFALGQLPKDFEHNYNNIDYLSKILAKTDNYNGIRFDSLAALFKVSIEAMAIRLIELELLAV